MTRIGGKEVYTELLQYLTHTGAFNMRMVVPDKWGHFAPIVGAARGATSAHGSSSQLAADDTPPEAAGLQLLNIPTNEEFGAFINRIYDGPYGSKPAFKAPSVVA